MKENRLTDTTARNYQVRAENLIMGAAEQFGVDRANLEQIEEYLLVKRASLSKTSWICYRNALAFYLSQECGKGKECHKSAQALIQRLKEADLSVCKTRKGSKTSALKKKEITPRQMDILLKALNTPERASKAELRKKTLYLFVGGILTGVRPVEWESAEIVEDQSGDTVLRIKTAKAKKGEKKEVRTVPLPPGLPQDVAIENIRMINTWKAVTGDTDSLGYIHKCRLCLRAVVKKALGPNVNVTLYDTRHQFASNIKGLGISQEKVAKLLGHKKVKNSSIYGKKSRSWVKPTRKGQPEGNAENQSTTLAAGITDQGGPD